MYNNIGEWKVLHSIHFPYILLIYPHAWPMTYYYSSFTTQLSIQHLTRLHHSSIAQVLE